MKMDWKDRERIRLNYIFLEEELVVNNLLSHFVQEDIIDINMKDEITVERTRKGRATKFLDKFMTRNGLRNERNALRVFYDALVKEGCSHIKEKLEQTHVPPKVHVPPPPGCPVDETDGAANCPGPRYYEYVGHRPQGHQPGPHSGSSGDVRYGPVSSTVNISNSSNFQIGPSYTYHHHGVPTCMPQPPGFPHHSESLPNLLMHDRGMAVGELPDGGEQGQKDDNSGHS